MSAITADLVPEQDVTYGRSPAVHFVTDVWVLTKRSIARIRREPETLADVTIHAGHLHPDVRVRVRRRDRRCRAAAATTST